MDEIRSPGTTDWVFGGFLRVLVMHAVFQTAAFFFIQLFDADSSIMPLLFIGLSQLVYVVPAVIKTKRRGLTETSKGIILAAIVTFLLNAACFGLIILEFSGPFH